MECVEEGEERAGEGVDEEGGEEGEETEDDVMTEIDGRSESQSQSQRDEERVRSDEELERADEESGGQVSSQCCQDTDQSDQEQQAQSLPVAQSLLVPSVETPQSCLHPLEASIVLLLDVQWNTQLELLRASDVK